MRAFLIVAAVALSEVANADLITSVGALNAPDVIDFSQFSGTPFIFTPGPTQVGAPVGENITYNSTSAFSVIGTGTYGLGANGAWNSGRGGFVGTNAASGATISFRFNSGPVLGVGGFVNYSPTEGAFTIAALAADNSVLESYTVSSVAPILTPLEANAGAFRGIQRADADIFGFSISGALGVLDDLSFTRTAAEAVPEPSSMFLVAAAGLIVGGVRRCRNLLRESSRAVAATNVTIGAES